MDELFLRWTQLQALPEKTDFTPQDMLKHILEEISILEKLLALGCYRMPETGKDVRTLLHDRQQELRKLTIEAPRSHLDQ